jgi:RND family efflux transporter MFP subunit
MKNNRFIAVVIGISLVVIGVIGAIALVKTKPEAQRKRGMSGMIPVVEAIKLEVSSQPLVIEGLGTVIADKSATMKSEVSGRIVAVSDALVEGGRVQKGDVLLEIDDAAYLLDVADAEGDLLDAQADLRLEEGQQAVARHEMNLIGEDVDEAYKDLMLREPQLKSAQAAVMSAQAALDSATLDLQRTKITAPFDGVIVSVVADIGDYASTSTELVELAAINRYFVRAAVPLSSLLPLPMLGKKPYSAVLTLSDGTTRRAQSYKLLPDLTEKGRMAQLLLVVEDPYGAKGRPLLLNEMVRFSVQGETVDGVSLLPRKYLRDGNVVWMMDAEKKLRIVSAEVLQGYPDDVLVRVDNTDELQLVITDLSVASEGMQMRLVGDPASTPEKGAGEGKNPNGAEKKIAD